MCKIGKVYVIGLGPGAEKEMTYQASTALEKSEVIIGYTVYTGLIRERFPDKKYLSTPMRQEVIRCEMAMDEAMKGSTVAMVCSGDAGIYGMAGLLYEMGQGYPEVELEVVPGITAANGGAAVLGAPLMHDFAVISLSDLLTPWEKIEKRIRGAAMADFVICLYNPSSRKRADYLKKACEYILEYQSPDTVCGYVRNIGREGEDAHILTLSELKDTEVDMFTTVYIGNSQTRNLDGKMVDTERLSIGGITVENRKCRVNLAGIGMGSKGTLTEEVRKIIEESDVLIGAHADAGRIPGKKEMLLCRVSAGKNQSNPGSSRRKDQMYGAVFRDTGFTAGQKSWRIF